MDRDGANCQPRPVDVSAFLVVPLSAIVAFGTMVWATRAGREVPRLIWPCVFSTAVAALVSLRPPGPTGHGMWLFALFALAVPAALGTVIGGWVGSAFLAERRG